MAASPRKPEPGTLGPSPDRILCDFLLSEARAALRRYGLSAADSDDLVQQCVLVVLQRWETYRAEAGSLRQWIRGIVRNEVRVLRRKQGPLLPAGDQEQVDPDSEIATPESDEAARELLDRLLAELPIQQRLMVILVEICGLTLRKAAVMEKTSTTQAHVRHKAGMIALRAAAERWRRDQKSRGLLVLPFTLASLLGASRAAAAPPALREKVRRHVAGELGPADTVDFDVTAESEPPDRGQCPGAASDAVVMDIEPPSGRLPPIEPAAARRRRLLGLLGGVLGGVLLGPCLDDLGASAQPVPVVGAVVIVPDVARDAGASGPLMTAEVVGAGAPPQPVQAPVTVDAARAASAAVGARRFTDALLLDQGRAALMAQNPTAALDAFAEHRRRFPGGRDATTRDRLWAAACASDRARAEEGKTAVDARCPLER